MTGLISPTPAEFAGTKFTGNDVEALRLELFQTGLDAWQAAELISSFLSVRGYGISATTARDAFHRMGSSRCTVQHMHLALEKIALAM